MPILNTIFHSTLLFSFIVMKVPPQSRWLTLETENFAIHYSKRSEENENLAKRIAYWAELIYQKERPKFYSRPKEKVQIVLDDYKDLTLGYARFFPYNTICLYLKPPSQNLVNYRGWYYSLLRHELWHIFSLDLRGGLNKFTNRIFGRVSFPNLSLPYFMVEGLPTYKEGSSHSPYYQAVLKTSGFIPIDRISSYPLIRFPSSFSYYLYGSQFINFLSTRYGEDKVLEFYERHSRSLPFLSNFWAKKIFGKTLSSLYLEWQKDLKIESLPENLSSSAITKEGYFTQTPTFSFYGEKVYYINSNPHKGTALYEYDLISKKRRILIEGKINPGLSLNEDGTKIFYSRKELTNNFYYYDDLFYYDLGKEKEFRLTKKARLTMPYFFKRKILAVENSISKNNLLLLDEKGRVIDTLILGEDGEFYYFPKATPDGEKIVYIKVNDKKSDIWLYDLKTGWQIPLTDDFATEENFTFSPDGKLIYYISDKDGSFNLYAQDLATGKEEKLTESKTGIFSPAINPDGQRAILILLSKKGFDCHLFSVNKLKSFARTYNLDTLDFTCDSLPKEHLITLKAHTYQYHPLPTLLPKFYLPYFHYDKNSKEKELGIFTFGSDALHFHFYFLLFGLEWQKKSPFLDFTYTYRPLFLEPYLWLKKDSKIMSGIVGIRGPFFKTNSSSIVEFNSEYLNYNHQNPFQSKKNYLGLNFLFCYKSSRMFGYSIAKEKGVDFSLRSGFYTSFHGERSNYYSLALTFYLPFFFQHHILSPFLNYHFTNFEDGMKGYFAKNAFKDELKRHNLKLGLRYHFPLFWIERGLGLWPLYWQNLNGLLFTSGEVKKDSLTMLKLKKDVEVISGAELNSKFIIGYYLPLTFFTRLTFSFSRFNKTDIALGIRIPFDLPMQTCKNERTAP